MEKRERLSLRVEYLKHISLLSDEEAGRLFRAILEYGAEGEMTERLGEAAAMCFSFIAAAIDEEAEKEEQVRKAKRENGRKGGRPSKAEKAEKAGVPSENVLKSEKGEYECYRDIFEENIEYDVWECAEGGEGDDKEFVDALVCTAAEALSGDEEYLRVGRRDLPAEVVKGVLMKVRADHVNYILDNFKKAVKPVEYPRRYLLTALYNSVVEGAVNAKREEAQVNYMCFGNGRFCMKT